MIMRMIKRDKRKKYKTFSYRKTFRGETETAVTERQTNIQTNRDRQTDRLKDRQRQTDRDRDRQTDRHTETDSKTVRQTESKTETKTDRQTERQKVIVSDRQTMTDRRFQQCILSLIHI